MTSILVLRLSSMGDVLLTLPVMLGILEENPEVQLIFVTRKRFTPYFTGHDRLVLVPFDPEGKHKGISGLLALFREIRGFPFKKVVDLHGVLRTNLLSILLRISGRRIYKIRKYRLLRRKILKNPKSGTMPHTVERYGRVFEKAGFTGKLAQKVFGLPGNPGGSGIRNKEIVRIGMAPLSKHLTKNWGLSHFSGLINLLNAEYQVEIHLFGGPEDTEVLNSLSGPLVYNHAGRLSQREEISLIRTLDVFLSMDSANMHLASLAGIPTVSIWGATDPRLGFGALNQPEDYSIFADPEVVTCRPCSVYGEIPCIRTDAPMICMNSITPEKVFNKIKEILLQIDRN